MQYICHIQIQRELKTLKDIMNHIIKNKLIVGQKVTCIGVKDSSADFLKYLDKQNIALGTTLQLLEKESFDGTLKIGIGNQVLVISDKIANNLFVK